MKIVTNDDTSFCNSLFRFSRSAEWIPAMREVQQIVKDVRSDSFPLNTNIDGIPILTRFSNDSFALSLAYINWETDAIVGIELIRNIGIALGRRRKILNFSC